MRIYEAESDINSLKIKLSYIVFKDPVRTAQ
jgi:hypothetical protein